MTLYDNKYLSGTITLKKIGKREFDSAGINFPLTSKMPGHGKPDKL